MRISRSARLTVFTSKRICTGVLFGGSNAPHSSSMETAKSDRSFPALKWTATATKYWRHLDELLVLQHRARQLSMAKSGARSPGVLGRHPWRGGAAIYANHPP